MYMHGPFIGPVADFQNQWLNLKKKEKEKKKKSQIFKMTEKSLNQLKSNDLL